MSSFLEKDIEDFLVDIQQAIIVNGVIVEIIKRQVTINGGVIDCVGIGEDNCIYILELKKGIIDSKALVQLLNYMDYVTEYQKSAKEEREIKGVLIGENISYQMQSALKFLNNVYFVEYESYFEFNERNYTFTKEFLNSERYKKSCDKFNKLFQKKKKKGSDLNG